MLGSGCSRWVQGVHVGFKVSALGSRCSRWVRSVHVSGKERVKRIRDVPPEP